MLLRAREIGVHWVLSCSGQDFLRKNFVADMATGGTKTTTACNDLWGKRSLEANYDAKPDRY